MSTGTWALDTDSKRWLAVLAAACLIAMAMLAHSFMLALSPTQENTATVQKPAAAGVDEARTRSEPIWNNPQQAAATENQEVVDRVSPFDGKKKLLTKQEQMEEQQKEVHRQADYLRNLIATGKLPAGLGHLTKEQVDEMEKNGETIQ